MHLIIAEKNIAAKRIASILAPKNPSSQELMVWIPINSKIKKKLLL